MICTQFSGRRVKIESLAELEKKFTLTHFLFSLYANGVFTYEISISKGCPATNFDHRLYLFNQYNLGGWNRYLRRVYMEIVFTSGVKIKIEKPRKQVK